LFAPIEVLVRPYSCHAAAMQKPCSCHAATMHLYLKQDLRSLQRRDRGLGEAARNPACDELLCARVVAWNGWSHTHTQQGRAGQGRRHRRQRTRLRRRFQRPACHTHTLQSIPSACRHARHARTGARTPPARPAPAVRTNRVHKHQGCNIRHTTGTVWRMSHVVWIVWGSYGAHAVGKSP
jgi:hypothetical protein